MQFKEENASTALQISGYGDGGFRIGGTRYGSSLILFADELVELAVDDLSLLNVGHVQPLIQRAGELDVLLVGCGPSIAPLPGTVQQALVAAGLAFDLMDTGAAARTHNLLLSEGRRVATLLISMA